MTGLDEHVYVKMFGFKDVWHYYDYISLSDKVAKIRIPTFCLGACDDQVTDNKVTPRKMVTATDSNVCVAMTDYGAHCCHMIGPIIPKSWYPYPCMEFIEFLE